MRAAVLFVASNPTAIKFDFARELATIRTALSEDPSERTEVIARWSLSVSGLKSAVHEMRPDIVHLLSPGVDVITTALVLSDEHGRPEYAQPELVASAFAGGGSRPPRLVVLNTCHGRLHAEAIARHVGCVVAMDGVIYDEAAIEFAGELYSCLASGESLADSFERARAAVERLVPEQRAVPILLRGRTDPATVRFAERRRGAEKLPASTAAAKPGEDAGHCARIFCSYSHKDAKYRAELEAHLSLLAHQGAVHVWHDRLIGAGQDWAREIDDNIDHADLILLLVSADFLASNYCFGIETKRALERARDGKAHVIPILVRKCDLQGAPFAGLQWLPTGAKPVKNWSDRDSAWTDVAVGVRNVVERMGSTRAVALSR